MKYFPLFTYKKLQNFSKLNNRYFQHLSWKCDYGEREVFGKYYAQVLSDDEEIKKGKQLLYKTYIEIGKWKWDEHNPSGFKVIEEQGKKYLSDDFDDKIVFWLGGYHINEGLISIARLIPKTVQYGLDMTRYDCMKTENIKKFLLKQNLAEGQRFAVSTKFQGLRLGHLSLLLGFKLCSDNGFYMVHTPPRGKQVPLVNFYAGTVLSNSIDYGDNVLCNLVVWKPRECLVMYHLLKEKLNKQFKV